MTPLTAGSFDNGGACSPSSVPEPRDCLLFLHNSYHQFLISVLFCNFSEKSLQSLNMLSPHMDRENAFYLKPCLPVTSTHEVENVCGNWKGRTQVRCAFLIFSTSPVGILCLLCACSAQAGTVLVTPVTLFIYFDHLYIPFM